MMAQIVAVVRGDEDDLELALADLLEIILADNQDDFDSDAVAAMVRLTHLRPCPEPEDGNGAMRLAGFDIDLPDEVQYPDRVLTELAGALSDNAPFTHAVRFEDQTLQAELAIRAAEIFALEMKLRRVLTYVYLHAYSGGDPYALLAEEAVKPMGKEPPSPEQMKAAAENLFFHLTFSQYVALNNRPDPKLGTLIALIGNSSDFDGVRAELARKPVEQEYDAVFLAGLKSNMDTIERMRNCVAHNRRPSERLSGDYETVRPILDELLDGYLARLEL